MYDPRRDGGRGVRGAARTSPASPAASDRPARVGGAGEAADGAAAARSPWSSWCSSSSPATPAPQVGLEAASDAASPVAGVARLAAGQQPAERPHPLGLLAGRLVEAALGLAVAVGAAARAGLGQSWRSAKASISWSGSRGRARRSGCPGCRRSSRRPGSASIRALTEVCRPRPVTALTTPTSRKASGTSALTSVDLPTPLWPSSTLVRPASRSRSSVEVGAALRHDVRHPERAVGRRAAARGRRGRPWSGTAAASMPASYAATRARSIRPCAGLGVGQRGDDDELVGVGDDDALDGVVVVGRTPQHGRAARRPARSGPASRRRPRCRRPAAPGRRRRRPCGPAAATSSP